MVSWGHFSAKGCKLSGRPGSKYSTKKSGVRFFVRTKLQDQECVELPERTRAMGTPSWQEGNEQIIRYLRVSGLQNRIGKYSHDN